MFSKHPVIKSFTLSSTLQNFSPFSRWLTTKHYNPLRNGEKLTPPTLIFSSFLCLKKSVCAVFNFTTLWLHPPLNVTVSWESIDPVFKHMSSFGKVHSALLPWLFPGFWFVFLCNDEQEPSVMSGTHVPSHLCSSWSKRQKHFPPFDSLLRCECHIFFFLFFSSVSICFSFQLVIKYIFSH